MKKLLMALLVGTMTITLLTACSEQASPTDSEGQDVSKGNSTDAPTISAEGSVAVFRGIIEEISDDTAIVIPNDSEEHILSSGDKVTVNLSVADNKFVVGDEVVVYYTGEIMESYPLQINTVDVGFVAEFESAVAEYNLEDSDIKTAELLPTAKIAINIEGFVVAVEGNKITLDSGKIVLITDETVFETENVGNFIPVDDDIVVGNFIQGFTLGDADAAEVIADFISSNGIIEMPTENPVANDNSSIIDTEIIINVTEDYDGTLTKELVDLGVVSVENIFDLNETVMYVITTKEPVENIIEKLEKLSYVNYAEYNQVVSIAH